MAFLIGTASGGFVPAQRGFASLVAILYPLMGLCNIVLRLVYAIIVSAKYSEEELGDSMK